MIGIMRPGLGDRDNVSARACRSAAATGDYNWNTICFDDFNSD